jgi:hypothetical protein
MKFSFEEYKLYYESAEKVTDRRLETNRWNYSICISILVAIAALSKWSFGSATYFWLGICSVLILCIMAFLFCSLWIRQIEDFKSLNNAKFHILNEMAPNLEFDLSHPNEVISNSPFEKEWKKLEQSKSIESFSNLKIVALQSSGMEHFIPKSFRILFVFIFLFLLAFSIINNNTPANTPGNRASSAIENGVSK